MINRIDRDHDAEDNLSGTAECAFAAEGFPAAYVLDALDGDDAVAFARHLPGCPICQAETVALRATVAQLPLALDEAESRPSPALRARILDAVAADAADERAAPPVRALPAPLPFPGPRRLPQAYAAAAVILLTLGLGLLGWNLNLQRQVREARVERDAAKAELAVWSLGPTAGQRGSGEILYLRERRQAILVVNDLPPLGPSQVYQVWLIGPDSKPQGAGIFLSTTTGLTADLGQYRTLAITIEPGPAGSTAPTTTPLVTSTLTQ